MDCSSLQIGVSGIMRVKNDSQFIERCVESCIDALDELIIAYNDCSDDSPKVIERVRAKYPGKIKVYPYEYHVLSLNLSKEEYEYAKSLDESDPRLLCNYYNFALSKVSYRYAVKIDADQIYFTEKMKEWCDFYRKENCSFNTPVVLLGFVICVWMKTVNRLNMLSNHIWSLLPSRMPQWMRCAYKVYTQYRVKRYGDSVILSGLNLTKLDGKWVVPKGRKNPVINILPPFNGAGDHLFFEVTNQCYYKPFDSSEYASLVSNNYALIETFVCPRKKFMGGYFWFHLNMERPSVKERIKKVYDADSTTFENVETFMQKNYYEIDSEISKDMYAVSTRSFSHFNYAYSVDDLKYFFRKFEKNEI